MAAQRLAVSAWLAIGEGENINVVMDSWRGESGVNESEAFNRSGS